MRPRKRVIATLLDVAKAYDKVWRDGLLMKLEKINSPLWIQKFVASWSQNRSFRVCCGSALSSVVTATEGLPQGSSLSPLLYNVFVYDIPKFHKDRSQHLLQFADDTAFISVGSTLEGARSRAEKGLKIIQKYAEEWKITLNNAKTEVILFGNKRPAYPYLRMGSHKLRFGTTVKYLGVTFDRNLSFVRHTRNIKHLTDKRLGQMNNLTKHSRGLNSTRRNQLVKTIAIPTATYGMELWALGSTKAHEIMRTCQNKSIRRALGAPWYVRNSTLRNDVDALDLVEVTWARRKKMVQVLEDHDNPDIKLTGKKIRELQQPPI